MHRTEAANCTVANLYQDGPPGTRIIAADRNAVQEEICYAIEQAGLTLAYQSNDTYMQLKEAIEILGQAAAGMPSGTEAWFYQDAAPTGWTLDAVPADAVIAVKGGANAYNVAGGAQAGTWTQPNHTHPVGTIAFPNHSHAVGTIAFPNHSHAAGTLALAHTHNVGSYAFPNHSHAVGTIAFPNHSHDNGTLALSHTHALDEGISITSAALAYGVVKDAGNSILSAVNAGGGSFPSVTWTTGDASSTEVTGATASDAGTACTGATASDAGTGCTGSTANDASATCTGSTASDAGASITGTSDAASTTAVTGSTASDAGTACTGATASDAGTGCTGSTDNGATANTYRPLANVGIICEKD